MQLSYDPAFALLINLKKKILCLPRVYQKLEKFPAFLHNYLSVFLSVYLKILQISSYQGKGVVVRM